MMRDKRARGKTGLSLLKLNSEWDLGGLAGGRAPKEPALAIGDHHTVPSDKLERDAPILEDRRRRRSNALHGAWWERQQPGCHRRAPG